MDITPNSAAKLEYIWSIVSIFGTVGVLAKRLFLLALGLPVAAYAQSDLDNCAEQFIGGQVSNAPTIGASVPEQPSTGNQHLCYRDDGVTFFATEYSPSLLSPVWAAYKLEPTNYGPQGCSTFTREKGNCYRNAVTFQEFEICDPDSSEAGDFFYRDKMATGVTPLTLSR